MSRRLIVSIVLVAFVAMSMMLVAGCPKKPDEAAPSGGVTGAPPPPAMPGMPSMPGMPKVSKSGDTVSYTGKDEKGNAVSVTSKQEGKDAKMTVKTDKGIMTAEIGKDKVSQSDMGVAFYPGASVDTGINAKREGGEAASVQLVTLKTTDPYAKVAAFYKGKYGKGNQVMERDGTMMIQIKSGEGAGKMVMIGPAPDKKGLQIIIHSAGGM